MLDNVEKAGVANLVATMMNEGTKNKTPEQLEEAIGLLGASIRVSRVMKIFQLMLAQCLKTLKKPCPCRGDSS